DQRAGNNQTDATRPDRPILSVYLAIQVFAIHSLAIRTKAIVSSDHRIADVIPNRSALKFQRVDVISESSITATHGSKAQMTVRPGGPGAVAKGWQENEGGG